MIKQGYMVIIESYAGDGDDYNTCILTGLSALEAQWYREIFVRWKADSNENDLDDFVTVVKSVTQEYGYAPALYSADLNPDFHPDVVSSIAYDLFGANCEYTNRIRTAESIKMYYVHEEMPELSGLN